MKKIEGQIFKVFGILAFILIWGATSFYVGVDLLPPPTIVFYDVADLILTGEIFVPIYYTFLRVVGGLAFALLVGTGIGIIAGKSLTGDYLTNFLLVILMTTPSLVIILAFIIIMGVKFFIPSLAAGVVVFPFVAVVVRDVTKTLSPELLEMAKSFGASLRHIVRDIYIPHLTPALIAQGRIGYSHCWKIVLLTEVFGMSEGIGWNVKLYFYNYQLNMVIAWLIIFLIVVLGVEEIIRVIEKRAMVWKEGK
jgi:NitT/TauT family transport system permease protein